MVQRISRQGINAGAENKATLKANPVEEPYQKNRKKLDPPIWLEAFLPKNDLVLRIHRCAAAKVLTAPVGLL